MEDFKDQLKDFNELHKFGMEFLTKVEATLNDVSKELSDEKVLNKNLSAELLKFKSEFENLRGKLEFVNAELENVKRERDILREKLNRLKNILAG